MGCTICPRACGIDRTRDAGYCLVKGPSRTARIALHFFEEPPISGTRGSGTVFFTGCNLRCVFCQNEALRDGRLGAAMTAESLAKAYLRLQAEGAHNINLVTPAPHVPIIRSSLRMAKEMGLTLPIVYNTNAYECENTLKLLEGLIDIYLPDFKYVSSLLAKRFSDAEDYAMVAEASISEMLRQVGNLELDENGLAKKGVLIRHLVLPDCVFDTRKVLDRILTLWGNETHISLMSQYTPTPSCTTSPLNRRLTQREYDRAVDYALSLGFSHIYIQDRSSADLSYTPNFFED